MPEHIPVQIYQLWVTHYKCPTCNTDAESHDIPAIYKDRQDTFPSVDQLRQLCDGRIVRLATV